jgi:hypothetical protein
MNKRLGFLDVYEYEGIFSGAIIMTDSASIPVEVRWAAPLELTSLQRIAYGKTLVRHISIECIAIPLLANLERRPDLILICRDYLLALRHHVETPVLLINRANNCVQKVLDPTQPETNTESDTPLRLPIVHDKNFEDDSVHVPYLKDIFRSFDPFEVFGRIPVFLKAQKR